MSTLDDDAPSDDYFTTSSPTGDPSIAEWFLVGVVTIGNLLWSALMAILRLPIVILDLIVAVTRE